MTEEEHREKLERIEFLMDKDSLGFVESRELEDLSIEVEKYEGELYD